MPDWLKAALTDAASLPADDRLAHVFQAAHNDMEHGSGLTQPLSVTQALVGSAAEITAVVTAESKAAARAAAKKAD